MRAISENNRRLGSEIAALAELLAGLQQRAEVLQGERDELRRSLDAERTSAQALIEELTQSNETLLGERESLRQNIDSAARERADDAIATERERNSLTQQIAELSDSKQSLQADLARLQQ